MKFSVEITGRGTTLQRMEHIYFSPEFNRAVAEATELLEREERHPLPDGREMIRTRVVPRIAVPAPVQKALRGQTIRYDEVVIMNPVTNTGEFSIRTIAGKTVQVNGAIAFVQDGRDVRIRFDGEARVHLFGIGGMLERYLVSEVSARYAKAEKVVQRFIDAALHAG